MKKFILPTLFVLLSFFLGSKFHDKEQFPSGLDEVSVLIQTKAGMGSGTIINKGEDTYVLTANHILVNNVIKVDDRELFIEVNIIQMYLYKNAIVGEINLLADIVAHSEKEDVAILHVKGKNYFPESAKIYKQSEYKPVGSRLYHVGCYYGRMGYNSISDGIISGYGRLSNSRTSYWVQTSCAIHSGSSGGGIFLANGEYVGMALATANPGMSYYNPVQNIRRWAETVKYGFLFN
jgi:serine protease Do